MRTYATLISCKKSYSHLNVLVEQYDRTLLSIIDKHAPQMQRQITVRPSAPWYTQEVADGKNKRRRLERKWRKSKMQSNRERYVHQCYVVNNLICNLKTPYYREIVSENSSYQKVLFNTVNKLLQKSCVKRYHPSSDACSLANAFADFFAQKIDKTRAADPDLSSTESTRCQVELSDFAVLSQDTVKEYACKSAKKSCNLDPLPASLMKNCLDMLLPTITNIVNLSLSTGTMPETLKVAELVPALKKHDADHEQFSNFRPISILVMVSKVIEKAVSAQLTDHVRTHHLEEWFQSAYKTHHSTETALVKVYNDILRAIDDNRSVLLPLLDLSVAFDTVDHSTLLLRLRTRFGVKGSAFAWFESYLASCKYYVQVQGYKSSPRTLDSGVPQGSVLGPLFYVLYTSPVADIIKCHGLQYHFYADDTQLYITFKTDSADDACFAKSRVEHCVKEIDRWMMSNKLKLNDDKTALIVFSSKFRPRPCLSNVQIASA